MSQRSYNSTVMVFTASEENAQEMHRKSSWQQFGRLIADWHKDYTNRYEGVMDAIHTAFFSIPVAVTVDKGKINGELWGRMFALLFLIRLIISFVAFVVKQRRSEKVTQHIDVLNASVPNTVVITSTQTQPTVPSSSVQTLIQRN